MNHFWKNIIRPILESINAKYIIEIGSDTGLNTEKILEYCVDNDAHMTAIDPFPKFDVEEFKIKYGNKFEIYEELSLNRLPLLNNYDAVLIDGDHNWYTVYNELKVIEKNFNEENFPIIFFHDVSWPYSRRDLYYNPENIPEKYRHPYEKLGITPGEKYLKESGIFNAGLNNTIYENTPKNGVLTAIEDFINESTLKFSLETINSFHGLGILYSLNTKIDNIMKKVINNADIISVLEEERIKNSIKEIEKDIIISEKDGIIFEKNNMISEKDGIIFEKNNMISEKDGIIFEKDAILKIYDSSFSWRITKPVRWFGKVLRKIRYNPFIFIFLKSNIRFKKFINDFKSYNIIKNSKSFDENYYINTYPLLKNTYMNLILHYMYYGYKEGKNPNAVFDTNFYLNTHHDVERLKLNPFIHYIMYGDNALQDKSPNDLLKYYINKNRNKTKIDILFLSSVPYDFQYYQRPQHITNYFVEVGHQVHYFNPINPTFFKEIQITSINKNLQMIDLSSEKEEYITNKSKCLEDIIPQVDSYIENTGISDFLIFVEFPNWEELVKYLKYKYNVKVVFDILDDFLGFHTNNFNLLNQTNSLINISDLSITTSNYLYDKVKSVETDNKLELIRNGTEFEHFNKYNNTGEKRFEYEFKNDKPIVGYYGAIYHWFDFDKVLYLAEKRSEYNIILIGALNDSQLEDINKKIENLKEIENIKLLGHKEYNHLPTYLKMFDVAIIPFRSDLDLIKATNPIKFYEYLSMGKKIVATRIPELFPYENKFAYLTDNKDKFIDYVDKCINQTDELASDEEKISFAKSQDWQERFKKMDESIKSLYDKVSIIIVTYNNLEYTKKCLNSIFKMTAYPNYEIIIVDNNSNDGSKTYLEKLEAKCNNVIFISNDENLGFSKANNIGIKKSSGEYIILLNNDTIVTSGWISSFIRHLSKRKAIVGPVTSNCGNEAKINVDYVGDNLEDIDEFGMKCRNENFDKVYPYAPILGMFCLAMKRETFEDIGFLDETFEVGMFEDDDYSHRAKLKGYELIIAEDIFIHHYGGASFFKLDDKEYKTIFDKNQKLFEEKWGIKWIPGNCQRSHEINEK